MVYTKTKKRLIGGNKKTKQKMVGGTSEIYVNGSQLNRFLTNNYGTNKYFEEQLNSCITFVNDYDIEAINDLYNTYKKAYDTEKRNVKSEVSSETGKFEKGLRWITRKNKVKGRNFKLDNQRETFSKFAYYNNEFLKTINKILRIKELIEKLTRELQQNAKEMNKQEGEESKVEEGEESKVEEGEDDEEEDEEDE
jgi:hypothetical protein